MTGIAAPYPEPGADPGSIGAELDAARKRLAALRAQGEGPGLDELVAEIESAHEELRVADEEVRAQRGELDLLIRSQHTARTAHDRLIAVLPAPVLVTDAYGVVHTANAAAAGMLGVRLDRLLRKPVFVYVEPGDRGELRQMLLKALDNPDEQFRTLTTLAVLTPRSSAPQTVEVAATVHREETTQRTDVTWVLIGNPRRDGSEGQGAEAGARGGAALPGSVGARLARTVVELTRLPIVSEGVPDLMARVARLCQHAFPYPVAISITAGDPAAPDLVATDSALAQAVDGAQILAGEGPCVDAWKDQRTVSSPHLAGDARWPRLAAHLAARTADPVVTGVVAVPVTAGERTVGALNIYSVDAGLADAQSVEAAELLGATVSAVLHETEVKSELETVSQQLQTALESRATIDQAKGIVMALKQCGPDEAFRHLVRLSSESNTKLRDVAARLVAATGSASTS